MRGGGRSTSARTPFARQFRSEEAVEIQHAPLRVGLVVREEGDVIDGGHSVKASREISVRARRINARPPRTNND